MTIDITSFFFNSSIEGATATAAWGTSVGQNQSKECRIEDEKPGVLELLTGMLYKSISDRSRLDISAGSSNREVVPRNPEAAAPRRICAEILVFAFGKTNRGAERDQFK